MKPKLSALPLALLAVITLSIPLQTSAGEAFGLGSGASIYVDPSQFQPIRGPDGVFCGFDLTGTGGYYSNECDNGTSSGTYYAPFQLPEGARITNVYVHFFDNDAAGAFTHQMYRGETTWNGGGTPSATSVSPVLASTDSADYQMVQSNPSSTVVYDTYDQTTQRHSSYYLRVNMSHSNTVRYRGTWILYSRQIAPAPATASFTDVPTTHPFFNEVQQLVKSGVTFGCGGGNYCPDAAVTRGQMAAFLSRALGLHWDFQTQTP